jgi:hypothetical protein
MIFSIIYTIYFLKDFRHNSLTMTSTGDINMKLVLFLLTLIFFPLSLSAETLNCKFDDYSQSSYPIKISKSWVPENQKIEIEDDKVSLWKFTAPLKRSGIKYKWTFDASTEKTEVELKYIYFKSNNKISVDVDFKSYRDITPIWGKCISN